MSTTKSPRRVLQYADLIGWLTFRPYSSKYSRKTFTQPQLFVFLVLKEFLQLDYRKLSALLRDSPDLAGVIELQSVPHFTTLQKAAARLLTFRPARRLLDRTIQLAWWQGSLSRKVPLAALDGTGLASRHANSYYLKRRTNTGKYWQRTTYQRFPKAGILCDCRSHLILAVVPGRGPGPDIAHFRAALDQALSRVQIAAVAADAGYDAEHTHQFARQQRGVRPRKGVSPEKVSDTFFRSVTGDGRCNAVCISLGSALRARSYWSQGREILLRTITRNGMILRPT